MESIQPVAQSNSVIVEESTGLNLKKIIFTFLQYWWLFGIAVFICLLLAFLFLRYTTPVYKISSKILIKDEKNSPSGNQQDLLGQLDIFNTKNNVNNEKAVLQTHYLLKKVVNEMQLNVHYFASGSIKSTELYNNVPFKIEIVSLQDSIPAQKFTLKLDGDKNFFTIKSDSINGRYHFNNIIKTSNLSFVVMPVNINAFQKEGYEITITTDDIASDKYLSAMNFDINDKEASVIEISLKETIPKRGEDVLNKLYDIYTRINEEDKNRIADSTISFIDERLAVVSAELSGVEKDIEQFKVKNRLSTNMTEQADLALNNASDVQKQITEQAVQLNVVQSIEDHLKGVGQRVVPNAAVIQDPTYIATVQEYNALVLERDRQLQTTKPDNPIIQNLNNQIAGVKNNLLISLENIKRELQVATAGLANKNAQFMSEIQSGPQQERAFLDISRQQDVKQQLYLYLLQKREETAISKSGTLANSRLIEPGKSDALPFTPKKSLIYFLAFCCGVLIPSAFIYLRNLLNNTIQEGLDIAKETKAPVLGEIGHNVSGKAIVAEPNSRTALSEQFRALRTNLQFLLKGKEHQIVMITSSTSGEGKSFLTVNLGSALAISNKKIVLIELDLRKPKISKELGLSTDKGFTDYVIGNLNKEEIIKPSDIHENLFVISSGTIPPNPAELLLDEKVTELFTWLRAKFDYIIVDTPPAGIVIDAVLIGKYADASVYVIRQRYTFKEQLKIINDFKETNKIPNVSIVVNDVKLNRTYSYRYGYRYGYGYGYGYGSDYYSDSKKKK